MTSLCALYWSLVHGPVFLFDTSEKQQTWFGCVPPVASATKRNI